MVTVLEAPVEVMTTTTSAAIKSAVSRQQIDGQPYLFTVAQFEQMVANGILTKSDKVELLEGYVIRKMTVNAPHRVVVHRLLRWLQQAVGESRYCYAQSPVDLQTSQPEPDLAICKGPESDYLDKHPQSNELLLIIEVSASSLRLDRNQMQRIYAQAGIPSYWIVNSPDRVIEIYTDPDPTASEPIYRMMRTIRESEMVALVLDGTEVGQILVKDLLP